MVVMATVNGYPADKDHCSVYAYIKLTNLTQLLYRNFLSALQCISNQQSSQIKALVKYSHRSSTLPANRTDLCNHSPTGATELSQNWSGGENMGGASTEAKTGINRCYL